LGVERQGVRACADKGGHDHIDGDVARAYVKGEHTDFRDHIDPSIADQLSPIRIKELDIEVHLPAVVQGHDQAEILLDQDAVAIHIGRIKDTPIDGKTIVDKHIAQELSGEKRIVRFSLANQETAVARALTIAIASPTATSQGSSNHEYAYHAY
jgi:hypothetical protein